MIYPTGHHHSILIVLCAISYSFSILSSVLFSSTLLYSTKRLGASRGTMFVIGGVAALKQHPFFEDIDWTDLINLELDPPIDLSKPYVTPNSSGNNNSNNNNNNNNPQTPVALNAKKGDINSPALTNMNMNTNINGNKDRDIERENDREGRSCPITPRTRTPYDAESLSTQTHTQTMTLPLTVEHLTRHFHEGFTGQQVSLSDVEESYSTSTLSRAGILSYLHLSSIC